MLELAVLGVDLVAQHDPAVIQRRTRSDGLGRLVEVVEDPGPEGSDHLAYSTVYGYDQSDQLTQVRQTRKAAGVADATQTRTFAYDSLGRLRTATNPESGPTGYTYDANGNVTLVTLSDGVTRSYEYNARDQVTRKSYSPATTPATIYCYDGRLAAKESTVCGNVTVSTALGRLTGVGTKVGTGAPAEALVTNYTGLDWMGRVVSSEQWVDGRQYALAYGYLLGGPREYVVYPSGRRVNYAYDGAGRAEKTWAGAAGSTCSGAGCYASEVSYTAGGAMRTGTFGTLGQTWDYNSRQQVEHITVTRDSTVKWKLDNVYPTSGNNGNVTSQTVDATGAGGVQTTATYGYDRLNRLVSVGEGAGGVGQVYGYDSVGNRWLAGHTNWEPPAFTPVGPAWYEGATNRMVNAALPVVQQGRGNLTAMGGYGLEYDAEDREVKATLGQNYAQYWYDGEGRRVKKLEQRETAEGTTVTATVYVYDAGGEMAAEYGSGGGGSGLQYLVADHLGSTRLVVGAQMSCHDYTPFGEEIGTGVGGRNGCYGTGDGVTQKFTGKERDAETGLDWFGNRYFSGAQGRFTSPDPLNVVKFAASDETRDKFEHFIADPQHWNRYAYVLNNPLRYTDPLGLLEYDTNLLGKKIHVHIDDSLSTAKQNSLKSQIDSAVSNVNSHSKDLTKAQIGIIGNIKTIDVDSSLKRSFVTEKTGALSLTTNAVENASQAYLGSTVAHDAFHVELFKSAPPDRPGYLPIDPIRFSRGEEAERKSTQFQLDVGIKIGLDKADQDYLRKIIADPTTHPDLYKPIR